MGKTVVAAAICAALAARGERVAAFKPAVTGLDEPPGDWPRDHELLAAVASAGQAPDRRRRPTVRPAGVPPLRGRAGGVADRAGRPLAARARAADDGDVLVCEGVGGLLVPLTPGYLVRDLAARPRLPLVIAARPGLGTINHTLLTLEAARAAGLEPAGVVMTPWPDDADLRAPTATPSSASAASR